MDASNVEIINIAPQPGPQTAFLECSADIALYGGSAGSGKSYGLLLDAGRYYYNPKFAALILRRTLAQIKKPGALWDEAGNLYPLLGGKECFGNSYEFPSGAKIVFGGVEHEQNKFDFQGVQVPFLGLDELTAFSETQFVYLFSRVRSTTGIMGYVRATCNPDASSWLKAWVQWWIDPETGLPIAERSGVLRWFIRIDNKNIWADTKEELIETYGDKYRPLSFTFISAKIHDNKILLDKDPGYLAMLNAMDKVERGRLLDGNWNIMATAGEYFNRGDFSVIPCLPAGIRTRVRFWDRAATKPTPENPDPDATAGIRMSRDGLGFFYIEHLEHLKENAAKVQSTIANTASQDGASCKIGLEQEPGASGKFEAQFLIGKLSGYTVKAYPATGDKITRATPFASQVQAGNVIVLRGPWNETFFSELENFPTEGVHDDIVDACSGAFNMLNGKNINLPAVNLDDPDFQQENEWNL